ncbi:MAG TPA: hypothetical protein DC000_06340 [Clostridiales bacterium]|nr:hypothetical protein [Clostridiales bacterium]
MLSTKLVTSSEELEELFRIRYRIFVVEDKDAPAQFYPDGIMKDECDKKAFHIGCYEDGGLIAFLSIVLKEVESTLPIEKQHGFLAEKKSAEVMRLIIDRNKISATDMGKRAKIINLLLKEIKKIVLDHNLEILYLVSTENAFALYKRIGFEQVGPYKLYENVSYECPMKLKAVEYNDLLI